MKIFSIKIAGYEINLLKNTKYDYIVQYGRQQYAPKYYAEAAEELGRCIMHALACEGKLNEEE